MKISDRIRRQAREVRQGNASTTLQEALKYAYEAMGSANKMARMFDKLLADSSTPPETAVMAKKFMAIERAQILPALRIAVDRVTEMVHETDRYNATR